MLPCFLISQNEIIVAANGLEKMAVCPHGINRCPERTRAISKTAVVVPVDVAEVGVEPVVVAEVVVVAASETKP